MGKYSKYKDTMVKFQQEPSWQQEIDALKPEILKLKNAEISEYFSGLKDEKAELEKQIKEINTKLEACSQILVERLEEDGITSFKTDLGTFYIKDEPYSSVSDRPAFYSWVRENKLEDLFTIHYQTMSGMVKERLENGEELPPGISVFMKSSIQRRTSKA